MQNELHEMIGRTLAGWAVMFDCECLEVDRWLLSRLLNLRRINGERVRALRRGVEEWFPYVHTVTDQYNSVQRIYFSKRSLDEVEWHGMTLEEQRDAIRDEGIRTLILDIK